MTQREKELREQLNEVCNEIRYICETYLRKVDRYWKWIAGDISDRPFYHEMMTNGNRPAWDNCPVYYRNFLAQKRVNILNKLNQEKFKNFGKTS